MASCGRVWPETPALQGFYISTMAEIGWLWSTNCGSHGRGPRFDPLCVHHSKPGLNAIRAANPSTVSSRYCSRQACASPACIAGCEQLCSSAPASSGGRSGRARAFRASVESDTTGSKPTGDDWFPAPVYSSAVAWRYSWPAVGRFGNIVKPQRFVCPTGRHGETMFRSALVTAFVLISAPVVRAESGLASYYRGTGSRGEMTCAHRTRAFGSMVTVTHAGHSIRCRINDRGPFVRGRIIDVSTSAARALGMIGAGVVLVSVD
jgi:rare lipoprotein A